MAVLIGCSAFFSASEAALFCLRTNDRKQLASGNQSQQLADRLLQDPERLLSAVLFWNLVVNILYFSIVSIIGLRLDQSGQANPSLIVGFATTALLFIIFFSEMLPKSLAVLRPQPLASALSIPLALTIRLVDPIMPTFRTVMLLSQRLLWPGFAKEPYLRISDLERAIEVSRRDAALIEQERRVLRHIVSLSDANVQEFMRPRKQFKQFRPPVRREDLGAGVPPSGFILVTDQQGDEIVSALDLTGHWQHLPEHLEERAEEIGCVPWCASVADALQMMMDRRTHVMAIVNEFGETIGVLTRADILEAVFSDLPGRTERLLHRDAFEEIAPGVWQVTGITNLSRLSERFGVQLPPSRHITLRGLVQEELQRLAAPGDAIDWGPFHMQVVTPADTDEEEDLMFQLRLIEPEGPAT